MNYINTAGWPPRDEMLERHLRGVSFSQLGREYGVGREKIKSYIFDGADMHGTVVDHNAALIAANQAFERAMRKAIERGRERAPIGVYKDSTPHPSGRLSLPGLRFSGCGSSAAACCD